MVDTDDVDAAHRFVVERGIDVVRPIEHAGPVSFFNFKDPDGNVLMACQQHRPVRDARAVPDGQILGCVTHVQLPARDLDRAVAWYVEHLGFTVYRRPHDDLAILTLSSGPTLFLWRTDDDTTANFTRNGEVMPSIGISCRDAEGLRAHLLAAGAEVTYYHVEENFATFLKFLDPFGNMIVVHQDH